MKLNLKAATAIAAITALTACEGQIAGGSYDNSAFGASTTNNLLAQAVSLRGSLLASLQAQFRQAAPDMVNFAFNQSTLDDEARSVLDRQAAWIRANPAILFKVYGHTDLVGSGGYNQRLGLRRAQTVVNYLVSRGVRRGQVRAVSSFGENRPLIATQNRERLNRRAVTEISGFDRRFADFDFDGKVANGIYGGYVAGSAAN